MQPLELIETAEQMLGLNGGNPSEATLRRALSTAYYALFHYLCRECADRLVGCKPMQRQRPAWRQAYRALGHGFAADRCKKVNGSNQLNFPATIRDFAALFESMQTLRERADYDMRPGYTKLNVQSYVQEAREMILKMDGVKPKHKTALAVFLVMPERDRKGH